MDDQKGYVIVTTALLLVVLLGFGALAVDVGLLYSARTAAQRAADAAALAGAFTFVVNPASAQPSTAYDNAMSTALSNNIRNYLIFKYSVLWKLLQAQELEQDSQLLVPVSASEG